MVSLLKCLQIVNCTATNVAEWMISIVQYLFYAVRTFWQEKSRCPQHRQRQNYNAVRYNWDSIFHSHRKQWIAKILSEQDSR